MLVTVLSFWLCSQGGQGCTFHEWYRPQVPQMQCMLGAHAEIAKEYPDKEIASFKCSEETMP